MVILLILLGFVCFNVGFTALGRRLEAGGKAEESFREIEKIEVSPPKTKKPERFTAAGNAICHSYRDAIYEMRRQMRMTTGVDNGNGRNRVKEVARNKLEADLRDMQDGY